jgi:hypothetical protein
MKLSKTKMVWLGALGLAVAALLLDRLAMGPGAMPKSASAEAVPSAVPAHKSADAAVPAAHATPAASLRLADRLKALATADLDPIHARDAFATPESWLAQPKPVEAPAAVAPTADPAEKFVREHKLTSVLLASDGGVAIVNGKVLRVGQEVDRFTLLRLEPGCAFFHSCDEGVDVQLRTQSEPH